MDAQTADQSLLNHIQDLVAQEHRLHAEAVTEEERARLRTVQVELDQAWDLLRQRRALRASGQDPDKAQVRSAQVVEKYEQ
ncbi:MAG: DUF2630 family protein [Nitrospiraceae bacterium]|jgi:hypothetical protein|nr:DUF2630 family protein [Nitrospiraceae bacterium]